MQFASKVIEKKMGMELSQHYLSVFLSLSLTQEVNKFQQSSQKAIGPDYRCSIFSFSLCRVTADKPVLALKVTGTVFLVSVHFSYGRR